MSVLTPERVAQLAEEGVFLAQIDLLREMEQAPSQPVTLRARPNDDGTWLVIATAHYCQCADCTESREGTALARVR